MATGNIDLFEWNNLISAEVLKSAKENKPIYLYVDEQLLARASGIKDKYEARDSFASAFISYCDEEVAFDRANPFKHVYALWSRYRNNPENFEYPFLAGIFMTVLAVTCDAPENIPEHSVYKKLRYLLDYPQDEWDGGILPHYQDQVKNIYEQWNDYLVSPRGRKFGKPTAHFGRLRHQGWAWSQCLLRPKDRWKILDWIQEEDVDYQDTESVRYLANEFLNWLKREPMEERRLLRKVFNAQDNTLNEDYFEIFLKIFEDELTTTVYWDDDEKKSRQALLSLSGGFDNQLTLAFKIDDQLDGLEISYKNSNFTLNKSLSPIKLPATDLPKKFITTGHTVDLGSLEIRFSPKLAYILEESPIDDSYVQTSKTFLNQEYLVVVNESFSEHILKDLTDAGSRHHQVENLVSGWRVIRNIVFTKLSVDSGSSLLPLPKDSVSPVLIGGLEIAPSTYLSGGEPLLYVPERYLDEVEINGAKIPPEKILGSLNLSDILNLGLNQIKVKEKIFFLEVSNGMVEVPNLSFHGEEVGHIDVKIAGDQKENTFSTRILGNLIQDANLDLLELSSIYSTSTQDDFYSVTEQGEVYKLNHLPRFIYDAGALSRWGDWNFLEGRIPNNSKWALIGKAGSTTHRGLLRVSDIPGHVRLNTSSPSQLRVTNLDSMNRIMKSLDANSPSLNVVKNALGQGISQLQTTPMPPRVFLPGPPSPRDFPLVTELPSPSNMDLILEWLSEIPEGRVTAESFKKSWDHLVRLSDKSEINSNLALFNLRQLGHVELVGKSQHVQVNPPHVHLLSGVGDHLILSGARPRNLINDLSNPSSGNFQDLQDLEIQFLKEPISVTTFYFSFDPEDINHVLSILGNAGINWGGDFRRNLGTRFLPTIKKLDLSPLVVEKPPGLESVIKDTKTSDSGLYVYQPHLGKREHFYRTPSSKLLHVSESLGYSAWRLYSQTTSIHAIWNRQSETLTLQGKLKLGDFAHRWLCSHSGVLPTYDSTRNSRTYTNIPMRSLEILSDSYKLNWRVE